MSRKRFSESQVIETLYRSGLEIPCFRCRMPLIPGQKIEREHVLEIALGGKDEPDNCAYSHKWCHFAITNGTKATTAGSSKQRVAKVRRIVAKATGEKKPGRKWPKGRKMQSKGFERKKHAL